MLAFRIVVAVLFAHHGAQKLFGWFGGNGLSQTGDIFDSLGLRPGRHQAAAAGITELAAAFLIATGLLLPLAAAFVTATMTAAFITVHMKTPEWGTNQGFELSILYVSSAFLLAGAGAGRLSLDHAFGLKDASLAWALVTLAVGILGGCGALLAGRLAAAKDAPAREDERV